MMHKFIIVISRFLAPLQRTLYLAALQFLLVELWCSNEAYRF